MIPSALENVHQIARSDERLAVFLDYDGTLTPIVSHPEDAWLPESMRQTLQSLVARVPVGHGRAVSQGDYQTPGVPGTAARIDLEYLDPAGSYSGRLLPTGQPCDAIDPDDGRRFNVSIVDAANPVVFCDARELSLRGTELPAELEARREVMASHVSIWPT